MLERIDGHMKGIRWMLYALLVLVGAQWLWPQKWVCSRSERESVCEVKR